MGILLRVRWSAGVVQFLIQAAVAAPEMALVPAGTFRMGDMQGGGWPDELPAHTVMLSAFRMDRMEVSNAEMCRVMQWALEQGQIAADAGSVSNQAGQVQELLDLDDWNAEIVYAEGHFTPVPGREAYPCVEVTWYGAVAYANFRSEMEELESCVELRDWHADFSRNGYRLPTEAEWEKAARGNLVGQHYPWPSFGTNYVALLEGAFANYWESGDRDEAQPAQRTTPVGYYNGQQVPAGPDMANGYGLYDMAGNVYEWCWDYYASNWYAEHGASAADTSGPGVGYERVVRGGSWLSGDRAEQSGTARPSAAYLRCANRSMHDPANGRWNRGFRCVRWP